MAVLNYCLGRLAFQSEARVDTCESFQFEAFVLGDVYFAFIRIASDCIFKFSETAVDLISFSVIQSMAMPSFLL